MDGLREELIPFAEQYVKDSTLWDLLGGDRSYESSSNG